MELDDSNWPELAERLTRLEMEPDELRSVVEHVAVGLVSYFGAEQFDVWRAKEGLHRHEAWEVAAVAVEQLAPLLNLLPAGAATGAVEQGDMGTPVVFPWEKLYPFG
ncbi:MAG: hypothetical protein AAF531_17655 [Actinomycetota bacterium]